MKGNTLSLIKNESEMHSNIFLMENMLHRYINSPSWDYIDGEESNVKILYTFYFMIYRKSCIAFEHLL